MKPDLTKCYKIVKALETWTVLAVIFTVVNIIILFSGDITLDVLLEILGSILIVVPPILMLLFAFSITNAVENDRMIIESNKSKK